MKILWLALLATQTLAHAGVIIVDEETQQKIPAKPGSVVQEKSNESTPAPALVVKENAATSQSATQEKTVQPGEPEVLRTVGAVLLPQPPAPVTAQPLDPAQQVRTYRLKLNDLTVRLALNRWLKEANLQLAYEAGEEFKASVEGDYTGTIPEVLFKLMTSLKQTKYPLRACEYDNRVVLVVHRDDVCPLEDE